MWRSQIETLKLNKRFGNKIREASDGGEPQNREVGEQNRVETRTGGTSSVDSTLDQENTRAYLQGRYILF